MREIKFRVFNDKLPEMIIVDADSDFVLKFGNDKPLLEMYSNGGEYVDQWAVDHVMQYTDLKDKNGVEIYEGDIVKSTYGVIDSIDVVEWSDLGFTPIQTPCDYGEIYLSEHEIEVIGNIHQHPELIKGE
jgi:uncharacterized phage protein (TIGR01671 family)